MVHLRKRQPAEGEVKDHLPHASGTTRRKRRLLCVGSADWLGTAPHTGLARPWRGKGTNRAREDNTRLQRDHLRGIFFFTELTEGERPYSDQECMDYELEYIPLHQFMNSRVGYCGAGAGDRKSEDQDSTEIRQSTSSKDREDRSTTSTKGETESHT